MFENKDCYKSRDVLVSVIVPVYNVCSFLQEALDSVLEQTYRNLEIIVIDDGSTDGSERICDDYARRDGRIRLIHQDNKGLSAARNAGLNLMTGDFVVFLDSDDAFDHDYINSMLKVQVRERVDIVICKYSVQRTNGLMRRQERYQQKPTIIHGIYNRNEALSALADADINSSVWNKLYLSQLWDKVRFPEGHVYEDVDTTYKIINKCNSIAVIDQVLYFHRKHDNSITSTNSKENIKDRILAGDHLLAFIEENTPGIFTEYQLNMRRQTYLNKLIVLYALYSQTNNIGISEDDFGSALRMKIIEYGKEFGVKKFSLRTRIVYSIVSVCPALVQIAYRGYYIFSVCSRTVKYSSTY